MGTNYGSKIDLIKEDKHAIEGKLEYLLPILGGYNTGIANLTKLPYKTQRNAVSCVTN